MDRCWIDVYLGSRSKKKSYKVDHLGNANGTEKRFLFNYVFVRKIS